MLVTTKDITAHRHFGCSSYRFIYIHQLQRR